MVFELSLLPGYPRIRENFLTRSLTEDVSPESDDEEGDCHLSEGGSNLANGKTI